ncbi:MAG: DUF3798 domain-containing protein [Deltaproteobacteria bacterium]|jgi:DNA-binding LacI/PurR family transcriptional regulator|nr:DUF3798 domain-containing protein [Deltaproteobacteria bacterium]
MQPEKSTGRLARLIASLAVLAVAAVAYLWIRDAAEQPPPLPEPTPVPASGGYVVAMAVGPRDVFPEENRAVDRLVSRYAGGGDGGIVRRMEIPADFEEDPERAAQTLLSLRGDLDVRALVAVPAFRGTMGAFAQLKRQRPDMLLLAYDSREDPGPMSMYSDLTVDPDFVFDAYYLAKAAVGLGVRRILYVKASRDLESPKAGRFLAVLRAASADLGLDFVEADAGPGMGEGAEGSAERARAWVGERCAGWAADFGPGVLFYSPSGPLADALLGCAASGEGYFLRSPRPSPYSRFPGLLGLPEEGAGAALGLSSRGFAELLNVRAAGRALAGRVGVWPVSFGEEVTEALGNLAVKAADGAAGVSEQGFMGALLAGNADGAWRRRDLTDAATGRRIKKHVLLTSDMSVLGAGVPGREEAYAPLKYRSIVARPDPEDPAPFRVGILAGSSGRDGDDLSGAREFERIYGMAGQGGMTRVSLYDIERIASETGRVTEALSELATDPLVKVIVANQAVAGTAEGFRRVKEFRQDILLFAMESREDPQLIAGAADLAVSVDFARSGYLIVKAARDMGADSLVHVSFPRHLASESHRRRLAVMRAAGSELGVRITELTAPDPADPEVGAAAARDAVTAAFPGWLAENGPNAAFFATNDSHAEELVGLVVRGGGIFVHQDIPGPVLGYARAFGLDPRVYGFRWEDYFRDLEARAVAAGASGRLGAWVYPLGFCESAGAADFGRRVLMGEAQAGDIDAFLESLSRFSGDMAWKGEFLTGRASGKPIYNYFLVYGDTYVLGRGYLGLLDVNVPEQYRMLGTEAGRPREVVPGAFGERRAAPPGALPPAADGAAPGTVEDAREAGGTASPAGEEAPGAPEAMSGAVESASEAEVTGTGASVAESGPEGAAPGSAEAALEADRTSSGAS